MIELIDKILDAMLALMGQLVYFENQSALKQTPEALYEADKKKIDDVIATHDLAGNDAIIDDLLMH
jgi:hypothetical protein